MKYVQIINGFRGKETKEQYLEPLSFHMLEDGLADDLVKRHFAVFAVEPEEAEELNSVDATDGAIKAAEEAGISLIELFGEDYEERIDKNAVVKRLKELEKEAEEPEE